MLVAPVDAVPVTALLFQAPPSWPTAVCDIAGPWPMAVCDFAGSRPAPLPVTRAEGLHTEQYRAVDLRGRAARGDAHAVH